MNVLEIMHDTLSKAKHHPKDDAVKHMRTCTECGSTNIVLFDYKQNVCLDCKSNLGVDLDFRPEWRNDDKGEDTSRCNMPRNELLPDSSMAICIGGKHRGLLSSDLARILIWNSVPHHERSLQHKMNDIAYVCKLNYVPEAIVETCFKLYHDIIRKMEETQARKKRANNDKGLKAAALYISFLIHHKPKTYADMAQIFETETRYVSGAVALFTKHFPHLVPNNGSTEPSSGIEDLIMEFCDALNMSDTHKERVSDIVDKVMKLGILENNIDTSIIAGSILFVVSEFGLPIKATDIHDRCHVSVPTINKVCEKITARAVDLL